MEGTKRYAATLSGFVAKRFSTWAACSRWVNRRNNERSKLRGWGRHVPMYRVTDTADEEEP